MQALQASIRCPIDIRINGIYEGKDPFATQIFGEFKSNSGKILKIPGFYYDQNEWRVRFSADEAGEWTYCIYSDEVALEGDTEGKVIVEGTVAGVAYALKTKGTRFTDSEGKPVFLLGHECNFLFSMVGSPDGHHKLEILVENLKKGGFNQVQVNSYAVDTSWARGRTCPNDYGPPYIEMWNETDDGKILNPKYFEEYDWMVDYLHRNGIYASIYLRVYNKYVEWPDRYTEEDITYWRHFAARYQAYPNVIWSISKEAYYEKDREYLFKMISMVRDMDVYHRVVTIHDGLQYALDPKYADTVDFITLQQHGEWGHACLYWTERTGKPVIVGEAGQEQGPNGILDTMCFRNWSPEHYCANAYTTFFGGGYYQYYSVYMAWDIIEYDYVPTGYRYFRQMKEFFSQYQIQNFKTVPEICPIGGQAHALDDGESTLLIYIEPPMPEYERYLCYNLENVIMHPNDSGRKFKSYKHFGILSGKYYDYVPQQPDNGSSCGYFVKENKTHQEALAASVMLQGSIREPVVVIIEYEKTEDYCI